MPLLTLLANLLVRLPLWLLRCTIARLQMRDARWVHLRLQGDIEPLSARRASLVSRLRRHRPALSLARLARLVSHLRKDPARAGLVVYMPRMSAGWAHLGAVRRLLGDLVASGKRVVVHLPEGAGDRELYVASAGTHVATSPRASIALSGFAAGGPYMGGLLDRAGLRAQVVAEGDYKTAAERLAGTHMSAPEREQLSALLATRQRHLNEALKARERVSAASSETLTALFERVFLPPEAAVAEGLIDHVCYEDGLGHAVGEALWADKGRSRLEASPYLSAADARPWRPLRPQPYLAVVPIRGVIQRGPGWDRSGVLRRVVSLDATVGAVRRARRDRRALGVLLYVDSPGGSSLVTDLIHHELEALAAEKPLVAFFANVAASGGYYVAAPARRIVAAPEAITGSIGVISVKLVAEQLFARLGVRHDVVTTAPHADMFSPARPFDAREQAVVEAEARSVYAGFLDVVAAGRGRPREEVEAVAGGRVWSAADAEANGLVDEIGDYELALDRLREAVDVPARQRAGLRPRLIAPVDRSPPPPPSPPSSDALAALAALCRAVPMGPELSLLELLAGDRERVLCCSLSALALVP